GPSIPARGQTTIRRTIPAGSASALINFGPIPDTIDEFDEAAILTILPASTYTVGTPSSATVTIVDDDPLPIITLSGKTVLEGDIGNKRAVVATATLSKSTEKPVSAQWSAFTGS